MQLLLFIVNIKEHLRFITQWYTWSISLGVGLSFEWASDQKDFVTKMMIRLKPLSIQLLIDQSTGKYKIEKS